MTSITLENSQFRRLDLLAAIYSVQASRYILLRSFLNKGIAAANLPSILRSKCMFDFLYMHES